MRPFRLSPVRLTARTARIAAVLALVAMLGMLALYLWRSNDKSLEPGLLDQRFTTLPPGAALPSGKDCAARIGTSTWEPRPQNGNANQTKGKNVPRIDGANDTGNRRLARRVDGNYTGTTDQIIRWGACKWGFDEDIVRAVATQESYWSQAQLGDRTTDPVACARIGATAPCYESYGLLQVKPTVHEYTWPGARDSTAFNVDYALAWRRACFEGYFNDWIPESARGDEWGCVGLWYTGEWGTAAAQRYVREVQEHLRRQAWRSWGS